MAGPGKEATLSEAKAEFMLRFHSCHNHTAGGPRSSSRYLSYQFMLYLYDAANGGTGFTESHFNVGATYCIPLFRIFEMMSIRSYSP